MNPRIALPLLSGILGISIGIFADQMYQSQYYPTPRWTGKTYDCGRHGHPSGVWQADKGRVLPGEMVRCMTDKELAAYEQELKHPTIYVHPNFDPNDPYYIWKQEMDEQMQKNSGPSEQ